MRGIFHKFWTAVLCSFIILAYIIIATAVFRNKAIKLNKEYSTISPALLLMLHKKAFMIVLNSTKEIVQIT